MTVIKAHCFMPLMKYGLYYLIIPFLSYTNEKRAKENKKTDMLEF
jgi:hypothetical protein